MAVQVDIVLETRRHLCSPRWGRQTLFHFAVLVRLRLCLFEGAKALKHFNFTPVGDGDEHLPVGLLRCLLVPPDMERLAMFEHDHVAPPLSQVSVPLGRNRSVLQHPKLIVIRKVPVLGKEVGHKFAVVVVERK